jgi:hypothetical protein
MIRIYIKNEKATGKGGFFIFLFPSNKIQVTEFLSQYLFIICIQPFI